MAARYNYRKNSNYESAYDVTTRYGTSVGEVEQYDARKWVAELNDGRRGFGQTRDAAVEDAKAQERSG
jgi:hypothetical protein